MKFKKNQKIKSFNNFKLHFSDPNISLYNRIFEDSLTTKNSQTKLKKNIISLTTLNNQNKLKLNNSKNIQNESISNHNLSLAEKILKNRDKRKKKLIRIKPNNNEANKLLINSFYSNSIQKKEHCNSNNNSLNFVSVNNLKESFYQMKSTKEKNVNTLKNIIDVKNNPLSLKNQITSLKKKIKFKGKINENNNFGKNANSNSYLVERNKENINNNFNNIFLNNNSINRQIHYVKNNSNDLYIDIDDYDLYDNKNNNEEFKILVKKYNILLEEKEMYRNKVITLQKENKKLKVEINNQNKKKYEIDEVKNINKELRKENEILKNEILNLKNKMNEIIVKQNNILIKDKIDEGPINCINSFCTSFPGKIMPTTERYIKKLEKENEELSNKILKYKNMFKFSHKE